MIGSLLTRTLALVLGYAYPAYECFKVVELNRPEIEQLRFWCKYWILVAVLTVLERVGDTFISWLPMYSEAKVAFFVYLWYPKTRGATYVYETFLQPYVASHETEIDRNLLELKTRAGDFAVLYWQKVANYGQTRVYEVLQYVASQAPSQQSRPRTTSQRQPSHQSRQTPATELQSPAPQAAAAAVAQTQQPNQPPSSPTKRVDQEPIKTGGGPSAAPTPSHTHSSSANSTQPTASENTSRPSINGEVNQIAASTASSAANAQPEDTPMEEAIRVTRGRLRRKAASIVPPSAH
ncbi:putative HVA22-like protein g isoform X1 [Dendrobium catenatum]|uniref:HVA22-like protein n=1 Tax=Dendrobium catenatum TaxID=906689 RepID=A0A2I0VCJ9_9ASPA|nr:putative HVA22-like protein g isoform X1 [Dendrobium catenatum]XP_020698097.1 putative HVA22-like protein g isoform X1 [Dendrobium catenatum]XP_020698098.1 putative HVA22-like protein g isoform X1 [Dendrobium catenatum]XP_020698099.1 putative HVA22-like protein g isoform X1 [Dendrobium catenatum]XP_028547962.1 putative HVA22-like protein g isoform X1 [Dendrobium catenatum]PKU61130.1 HVA22-like protein i [Dendrobium catenatum]